MYSNHPSEFPAEPLPVMIDPTLLIIYLLLLVVALVGGYAVGRWGSDRPRRKAILSHHRKLYDEINKVTQEAVGADRNHVVHKVERLLHRLQRELGDVIALGPVITAVEELRRSLPGTTGGDGDQESRDDAGTLIVNTGQIVIGPTEDDIETGATRNRSHTETIRAVRRAIHNFNDLWSNKTARLDELERALKQLTPPR